VSRDGILVKALNFGAAYRMKPRAPFKKGDLVLFADDHGQETPGIVEWYIAERGEGVLCGIRVLSFTLGAPVVNREAEFLKKTNLLDILARIA
jgi:hypothetical protein